MARPLRIDYPDYPGAFHHVTVRVNNCQYLPSPLGVKMLLLKHLDRSVDTFYWKIHSFTIMDNHFHILVESGPVGLSRIMQNLLSSYTMKFNHHSGRSGHLFQGRFHSALVERDSYFISVVKYQLNNSVRAGMIDDPASYPWSSYGGYFKAGGHLLRRDWCALSFPGSKRFVILLGNRR